MSVSESLRRIERKLDLVLGELGVADQKLVGHAEGEVDGNGEVGLGDVGRLAKLSTKRHAVLQLIVAGKSNNEIVERLGLSLNTVKVYVKRLMEEFDQGSRYALALMAGPMLNSMSDDEYLVVSGGLPKDWAEMPAGNQYDKLLRKRGC